MDASNSVSSLSIALEQQDMLVANRLPSSISKQFQLNDHSSSDQNSQGHMLIADCYDYFSCGFEENLTYDTVQKLFSQISHNEQQTRERGLDVLANVILCWANKQCNMKQNENENSINNSSSNCNKEIESESKEITCPTLMQKAIASLSRLCICCPFPDVRHRCDQILIKLKNLGVYIPSVCNQVSHFIPQNEINSVDTDDEQAYLFYRESFIHNCRLEHMVMAMASHPQYLNQFLLSNYALLQSNGSISYHWRSYIAIMAVARHRCSYLVRLFEDQFLLQGGDKDWLRGIAYAPAKLQALSDLNKLLAHRPWLVTPKHIKKLTLLDSGTRWQLPELLHAIILLCHFHSVAIFCQGAGINLEIDHQVEDYFDVSDARASGDAFSSNPSSKADKRKDSSHNTKCNAMLSSNNIETLMESMKKLTEETQLEMSREEMDRRFEIEKEEASHGFAIPTSVCASNNRDCSLPYMDDLDFAYQDFVKRDIAVPTFRAQDFNWTDHAYSIIKTYHGDVADILDDKFNLAHSLTYMTLGSKSNVDTTSLRGAVWKYVHCMYGIMYDDYDYGVINILLERSLKVFIKTASCFPERMEKNIYDDFWRGFRHSEKVHLLIMLIESRLQVGLLYGMRAFSKCVSEC